MRLPDPDQLVLGRKAMCTRLDGYAGSRMTTGISRAVLAS